MHHSQKRFLITLIVLVFGLMAFSACGGKKGPDIQISGAWARPSPKAATSGAAYMLIENKGNEDDALIKAEGDVSDVTEIHEMTIDENSVMHMKPVAGQRLVIPAKGKVELKPGSYHIMLIGLHHQLQEGETVNLILTFEKAGVMKVQAPVKMSNAGG